MKGVPPVVVAFAVVASLAADSSQISDTALRNYRSWGKMTDKPRSISVTLAIACAPGPSPEELATMKRKGPHFGYWVNVYMNDPGRRHFEAKDATDFPPGSIVVKEKLASPGEKDRDMQVAAVAGMIKHRPGYAPKAGDWEFFYFNEEKERANAGQLSACADCHREAGRDFVFGDFAKPETAAGAVVQPQ